ncbi:MAG: sigma-54-dependent Fis family transcriptional regulator [Deltaproteobacteria bacterium]|nr:sigma-54-dependent Fis family transcriptional regulator [Deltaproteobacteria bacterium]
MKHILVVDDDAAVRRTLEMHLVRRGYAVETAADGPAGVEKGSSEEVDLVLLDLRLPKMDGFEVLRELKLRRPTLPVVVITAYDDMQTAIEAIRLGALDHLGKPLDLDELADVLEKAAEMVDLSRSSFDLCDTPDTPFQPHLIVGRSRAMKRVFKAIGAVADSPATVLLHGESGTGKELVARAIHFNSRLKARPFITVTCSALAPTLLESELFGHEKGAFTGAYQAKPGKFELAQGGTLFLDEVSEVSPDIQVKLLRFLQEREFERVGGVHTIRADVRVLAATNRDLAAMMAAGTFRQDLYYRLRVVSIELPPLRERREDIPLLVKFFLEKIRREMGPTVEAVSQAAMDRIQEHSWPGNVRELENALRRAVLLSPGSVLVPEALQLERSGEGTPLPLLLQSLEEMERRHIENILTFTAWDKTRAARILNISRPTLNKRIREFGIQRAAR